MAELLSRAKHEAQFARKLSRLSARHRRELKALLGRPPDPANVPAEFWQKVEQETEEELAAMLLLIYAASARQHGMDKALADDRGRLFAEKRAKETAGRFARNSKQRILQGAKPTDVLSPTRAATIATTETTTARSKGIVEIADAEGEETVLDDGTKTTEKPVLVWELWHKRQTDPCTFCPIMDATGQDFWRRWFPQGPACHVVCQCGIIVMPPGTVTKDQGGFPPFAKSASLPIPSSGRISQAARESGVFGY